MDFMWGASSSAFQIEGAAREDGKGVSIWDVYMHTPGRAPSGVTGDVACDHYHRYKEDVQLMAELGINAYRFSIAWTRILPEGTGAVNEKGIAFYSDLIDELKTHGIEPHVTLYHWDLPQALQEKGGWVNPESPEWFYRYAKVVGERLGGRVKYFTTINEPTNVIDGITDPKGNAPGIHLPLKDRLAALHHLLKAHGRAVQALRETVPDCRIGYGTCCQAFCPVSENDGSAVEKARELFYTTTEKGDLIGDVPLYCDPVFLGDYPKEYYETYRGIHPEITPEDLALISQPVDYFFLNAYTGRKVISREDGPAPEAASDGPLHDENGVLVRNFLGWRVLPEALYWVPKFVYERYGKPVFITENGYPGDDKVGEDGKVRDPDRIEFIRRYTDEMKRAAADGIDIRGYFYWTFMDNLEWELGFGPRFGLIHVDFDTLVRTPKESFYFYRDLIAQSGL